MKKWFNNNIFDKNGNVSSIKISALKTKQPEMYQKIIDKTNFLEPTTKLIQRIYYVYYGIKDKCLCSVCNEPVNFINFNKGFNNFCSVKCAYKDEQTLKKRQETNLQRYGEKNVGSFGSESFKEKMIKKYDDPYYNNREKAWVTCLKNNGVKYPQQSEQIRETTKENNFAKYGVSHLWQSDEFKEKSKQTCLKRYGVEHFSQIDGFKERILSKRYETCLKRYGAEHSNQSHILNKENITKEFIQKNFVDKEGFIQKEEIQKYFNISTSFACVLVRKMEIEGKYHRSSYGENEIYDFLLKYVDSDQVIKNDRTVLYPLELDFYLPDYNLAIEFNGLYWHSNENGKDKQYHLMKTEMCKAKGIQLLHVFENEWNEKQEIWKSIILNYLKKNKSIFARKCKIIELNNNQYKGFLEENHLQGHVNASKKIGLFYNDELVACMSFGKPRYNTNYEWELLRFCNKRFTNVIGGANKLFKCFNGNNIISYANRKMGEGNLYSKLGFGYINTTEPSYFYFKGNKILSRVQCQKHKLNKLLDFFDSSLTEYQNMINNGYMKIFDCGNNVFQYVKKG